MVIVTCWNDGFLEMVGWPNEVARGVGRAVAVKARADWMVGALQSERSAARRILFAEIAKSRSEAQRGRHSRTQEHDRSQCRWIARCGLGFGRREST
jgi:hypothetical protein